MNEDGYVFSWNEPTTPAKVYAHLDDAELDAIADRVVAKLMSRIRLELRIQDSEWTGGNYRPEDSDEVEK